MTLAHFIPVALSPLIAWRLRQRFRQNVGRQKFRPGRTVFSVAIMSFALCMIGWPIMHIPLALWSLLGGCGVGIITGVAGCKLTRFEEVDGEKFYTPNAYLGGSIMIILILRIVYRMFILYTAPDSLSASTPGLGQSPLTSLIFGLTIGYYLTFNAFILFRMYRSSPSSISDLP